MRKRNRLTVLVFSDSGTRVGKIAVSKRFLSLCGCFILLFLLFSGYILFDYTRLKINAVQIDSLEKIILRQKENIAGQKKEIKVFAEKIDNIKSDLAALNDLERKIKLAANLEETDNQDAVFGLGGSISEDMDPKKVIASEHNTLVQEMHDQISQLEIISVYRRESLEQLLGRLKDRENLLAATPSTYPTFGWISSRFGYRRSPFTGRKEFHKGLDLAANTGSEIQATADGIVCFSGREGTFGKTITIDHGHGMKTRYAHLDKPLKKKGESVKRGDVIGLVGNTGRSTGSHLHYEIMVNGIRVNPEEYLLN